MKYAYWLFSVKALGNRKKIALYQWRKGEKAIYQMDRANLKCITREVVGEDGEHKQECLLSDKNIDMILLSKENWELEKEWEQLDKKGITFIPYGRKGYPSSLLEIPDPPYALTIMGTLPQEDKPILAIIGARNCSEYGRYVAREFGTYLGEQGIQIVSGMAAGIDGISQRACLETGTHSLGVLGCGVDICYPEQNKELYELLKKRGGVVSEYPIGTNPKGNLFPPRNRIISGIADAVLVVEAKQKSGTLITVDMALEQGKDVFAIPGRVTDALSFGCNQLIRQGAGIISSPQELLKEWVLPITQREGKPQKENKTVISRCKKAVLNDLEQRIYSHLELCPKSFQQLYEELEKEEQKEEKIGLSLLLEILIGLELKGVARSIGGCYFLP